MNEGAGKNAVTRERMRRFATTTVLAIAMLALALCACQKKPADAPKPAEPAQDARETDAPKDMKEHMARINAGMKASRAEIGEAVERGVAELKARHMTGECCVRTSAENLTISVEALYRENPRDGKYRIKVFDNVAHFAREDIYYDGSDAYVMINDRSDPIAAELEGRKPTTKHHLVQGFGKYLMFEELFMPALEALDAGRYFFGEAMQELFSEESMVLTAMSPSNFKHQKTGADREKITIGGLDLSMIQGYLNAQIATAKDNIGDAFDALTAQYLGFRLSKLLEMALNSINLNELAFSLESVAPGEADGKKAIRMATLDAGGRMQDSTKYAIEAKYAYEPGGTRMSDVDDVKNRAYVEATPGRGALVGTATVPEARETAYDFSLDYDLNAFDNATNEFAARLYDKIATDESLGKYEEITEFVGAYYDDGRLYLNTEGVFDAMSSVIALSALRLPKVFFEGLDITSVAHELYSGLLSATRSMTRVDPDEASSRRRKTVEALREAIESDVESETVRATLTEHLIKTIRGKDDDLASLLADAIPNVARETLDKYLGEGFFSRIAIVASHCFKTGKTDAEIFVDGESVALFEFENERFSGVTFPRDLNDLNYAQFREPELVTVGYKIKLDPYGAETVDLSRFFGSFVGDGTGVNTPVVMRLGQSLRVSGKTSEYYVVGRTGNREAATTLDLAFDMCEGNEPVGRRIMRAKTDPTNRERLFVDMFADVGTFRPRNGESIRYAIDRRKVGEQLEAMAGEDSIFAGNTGLSAFLAAYNSAKGASRTYSEDEDGLGYFGVDVTRESDEKDPVRDLTGIANANARVRAHISFAPLDISGTDINAYAAPIVHPTSATHASGLYAEGGAWKDEAKISASGESFAVRLAADLEKANEMRREAGLPKIPAEGFSDACLAYDPESIRPRPGKTEYRARAETFGLPFEYGLLITDARGAYPVLSVTNFDGTPLEDGGLYVIDPVMTRELPTEIGVLYEGGATGMASCRIDGFDAQNITSDGYNLPLLVGERMNGDELIRPCRLTIGTNSILSVVREIYVAVLNRNVIAMSEAVPPSGAEKPVLHEKDGIVYPVIDEFFADPYASAMARRLKGAKYDFLKEEIEVRDLRLEFENVCGRKETKNESGETETKELTIDREGYSFARLTKKYGGREIEWDFDRSPFDWRGGERYATASIGDEEKGMPARFAIKVTVRRKAVECVIIDGREGSYVVDYLKPETYSIPTATDAEHTVTAKFEDGTARTLLSGEKPAGMSDEAYCENCVRGRLDWRGNAGIEERLSLYGTTSLFEPEPGCERNETRATLGAELGADGAVRQAVKIRVIAPSRFMSQNDTVTKTLVSENSDEGAPGAAGPVDIHRATFGETAPDASAEGTDPYPINPYDASAHLPNAVWLKVPVTMNANGRKEWTRYPVRWTTADGAGRELNVIRDANPGGEPRFALKFPRAEETRYAIRCRVGKPGKEISLTLSLLNMRSDVKSYRLFRAAYAVVGVAPGGDGYRLAVPESHLGLPVRRIADDALTRESPYPAAVFLPESVRDVGRAFDALGGMGGFRIEYAGSKLMWEEKVSKSKDLPARTEILFDRPAPTGPQWKAGLCAFAETPGDEFDPTALPSIDPHLDYRAAVPRFYDVELGSGERVKGRSAWTRRTDLPLPEGPKSLPLERPKTGEFADERYDSQYREFADGREYLIFKSDADRPTLKFAVSADDGTGIADMIRNEIALTAAVRPRTIPALKNAEGETVRYVDMFPPEPETGETYKSVLSGARYGGDGKPLGCYEASSRTMLSKVRECIADGGMGRIGVAFEETLDSGIFYRKTAVWSLSDLEALESALVAPDPGEGSERSFILRATIDAGKVSEDGAAAEIILDLSRVREIWLAAAQSMIPDAYVIKNGTPAGAIDLAPEESDEATNALLISRGEEYKAYFGADEAYRIGGEGEHSYEYAFYFAIEKPYALTKDRDRTSERPGLWASPFEYFEHLFCSDKAIRLEFFAGRAISARGEFEPTDAAYFNESVLGYEPKNARDGATVAFLRLNRFSAGSAENRSLIIVETTLSRRRTSSRTDNVNGYDGAMAEKYKDGFRLPDSVEATYEYVGADGETKEYRARFAAIETLGNADLAELTIPANAISGIGENAFAGFERLTDIYYQGADWDKLEKGANWDGGRRIAARGPAQCPDIAQRDPTPGLKLTLTGAADANLSELVIPANAIVGIGANAFAGFERLTDIWYLGDDWDKLEKGANWNGGRDARLHLPPESSAKAPTPGLKLTLTGVGAVERSGWKPRDARAFGGAKTATVIEKRLIDILPGTGDGAFGSSFSFDFALPDRADASKAGIIEYTVNFYAKDVCETAYDAESEDDPRYSIRDGAINVDDPYGFFRRVERGEPGYEEGVARYAFDAKKIPREISIKESARFAIGKESLDKVERYAIEFDIGLWEERDGEYAKVKECATFDENVFSAGGTWTIGRREIPCYSADDGAPTTQTLLLRLKSNPARFDELEMPGLSVERSAAGGARDTIVVDPYDKSSGLNGELVLPSKARLEFNGFRREFGGIEWRFAKMVDGAWECADPNEKAPTIPFGEKGHELDVGRYPHASDPGLLALRMFVPGFRAEEFAVDAAARGGNSIPVFVRFRNRKITEARLPNRMYEKTGAFKYEANAAGETKFESGAPALRTYEPVARRVADGARIPIYYVDPYNSATFELPRAARFMFEGETEFLEYPIDGWDVDGWDEKLGEGPIRGWGGGGRLKKENGRYFLDPGEEGHRGGHGLIRGYLEIGSEKQRFDVVATALNRSLRANGLFGPEYSVAYDFDDPIGGVLADIPGRPKSDAFVNFDRYSDRFEISTKKPDGTEKIVEFAVESAAGHFSQNGENRAVLPSILWSDRYDLDGDPDTPDAEFSEFAVCGFDGRIEGRMHFGDGSFVALDDFLSKSVEAQYERLLDAYAWDATLFPNGAVNPAFSQTSAEALRECAEELRAREIFAVCRRIASDSGSDAELAGRIDAELALSEDMRNEFAKKLRAKDIDLASDELETAKRAAELYGAAKDAHDKWSANPKKKKPAWARVHSVWANRLREYAAEDLPPLWGANAPATARASDMSERQALKSELYRKAVSDARVADAREAIRAGRAALKERATPYAYRDIWNGLKEISPEKDRRAMVAHQTEQTGGASEPSAVAIGTAYERYRAKVSADASLGVDGEPASADISIPRFSLVDGFAIKRAARDSEGKLPNFPTGYGTIENGEFVAASGSGPEPGKEYWSRSKTVRFNKFNFRTVDDEFFVEFEIDCAESRVAFAKKAEKRLEEARRAEKKAEHLRKLLDAEICEAIDGVAPTDVDRYGNAVDILVPNEGTGVLETPFVYGGKRFGSEMWHERIGEDNDELYSKFAYALERFGKDRIARSIVANLSHPTAGRKLLGYDELMDVAPTVGENAYGEIRGVLLLSDFPRLADEIVDALKRDADFDDTAGRERFASAVEARLKEPFPGIGYYKKDGNAYALAEAPYENFPNEYFLRAGEGADKYLKALDSDDFTPGPGGADDAFAARAEESLRSRIEIAGRNLLPESPDECDRIGILREVARFMRAMTPAMREIDRAIEEKRTAKRGDAAYALYSSLGGAILIGGSEHGAELTSDKNGPEMFKALASRIELPAESFKSDAPTDPIALLYGMIKAAGKGASSDPSDKGQWLYDRLKVKGSTEDSDSIGLWTDKHLTLIAQYLTQEKTPYDALKENASLANVMPETIEKVREAVEARLCEDVGDWKGLAAYAGDYFKKEGNEYVPAEAPCENFPTGYYARTGGSYVEAKKDERTLAVIRAISKKETCDAFCAEMSEENGKKFRALARNAEKSAFAKAMDKLFADKAELSSEVREALDFIETNSKREYRRDAFVGLVESAIEKAKAAENRAATYEARFDKGDAEKGAARNEDRIAKDALDMFRANVRNAIAGADANAIEKKVAEAAYGKIFLASGNAYETPDPDDDADALSGVSIHDFLKDAFEKEIKGKYGYADSDAENIINGYLKDVMLCAIAQFADGGGATEEEKTAAREALSRESGVSEFETGEDGAPRPRPATEMALEAAMSGKNGDKGLGRRVANLLSARADFSKEAKERLYARYYAEWLRIAIEGGDRIIRECEPETANKLEAAQNVAARAFGEKSDGEESAELSAEATNAANSIAKDMARLEMLSASASLRKVKEVGAHGATNADVGRAIAEFLATRELGAERAAHAYDRMREYETDRGVAPYRDRLDAFLRDGLFEAEEMFDPAISDAEKKKISDRAEFEPAISAGDGKYVDADETPLPGFPDGYFARSGEDFAPVPTSASEPRPGAEYFRKRNGGAGYVRALFEATREIALEESLEGLRGAMRAATETLLLAELFDEMRFESGDGAKSIFELSKTDYARSEYAKMRTDKMPAPEKMTAKDLEDWLFGDKGLTKKTEFAAEEKRYLEYRGASPCSSVGPESHLPWDSTSATLKGFLDQLAIQAEYAVGPGDNARTRVKMTESLYRMLEDVERETREKMPADYADPENALEKKAFVARSAIFGDLLARPGHSMTIPRAFLRSRLRELAQETLRSCDAVVALDPAGAARGYEAVESGAAPEPGVEYYKKDGSEYVLASEPYAGFPAGYFTRVPMTTDELIRAIAERLIAERTDDGRYADAATTPLPGFPDGYFVRAGEGTEASPHAYSAVSDPIVGETYFKKRSEGDGYDPAIFEGDGKYVDAATTPLENFPHGYFLRSGEGTEASPHAYSAVSDPIVGETYYVRAPAHATIENGIYADADETPLPGFPDGYFVRFAYSAVSASVSDPVVGETYFKKRSEGDGYDPAISEGDGKYVDAATTPLEGFPAGYFTRSGEGAEAGSCAYEPATGSPIVGERYYRYAFVRACVAPEARKFEEFRDLARRYARYSAVGEMREYAAERDEALREFAQSARLRVWGIESGKDPRDPNALGSETFHQILYSTLAGSEPDDNAENYDYFKAFLALGKPRASIASGFASEDARTPETRRAALFDRHEWDAYAARGYVAAEPGSAPAPGVEYYKKTTSGYVRAREPYENFPVGYYAREPGERPNAEIAGKSVYFAHPAKTRAYDAAEPGSAPEPDVEYYKKDGNAYVLAEAPYENFPVGYFVRSSAGTPARTGGAREYSDAFCSTGFKYSLVDATRIDLFFDSPDDDPYAESAKNLLVVDALRPHFPKTARAIGRIARESGEETSVELGEVDIEEYSESFYELAYSESEPVADDDCKVRVKTVYGDCYLSEAIKVGYKGRNARKIYMLDPSYVAPGVAKTPVGNGDPFAGMYSLYDERSGTNRFCIDPANPAAINARGDGYRMPTAIAIETRPSDPSARGDRIDLERIAWEGVPSAFGLSGFASTPIRIKSYRYASGGTTREVEIDYARRKVKISEVDATTGEKGEPSEYGMSGNDPANWNATVECADKSLIEIRALDECDGWNATGEYKSLGRRAESDRTDRIDATASGPKLNPFYPKYPESLIVLLQGGVELTLSVPQSKWIPDATGKLKNICNGTAPADKRYFEPCFKYLGYALTVRFAALDIALEERDPRDPAGNPYRPGRFYLKKDNGDVKTQFSDNYGVGWHNFGDEDRPNWRRIPFALNMYDMSLASNEWESQIGIAGAKDAQTMAANALFDLRIADIRNYVEDESGNVNRFASHDYYSVPLDGEGKVAGDPRVRSAGPSGRYVFIDEARADASGASAQIEFAEADGWSLRDACDALSERVRVRTRYPIEGADKCFVPDDDRRMRDFEFVAPMRGYAISDIVGEARFKKKPDAESRWAWTPVPETSATYRDGIVWKLGRELKTSDLPKARVSVRDPDSNEERAVEFSLAWNLGALNVNKANVKTPGEYAPDDGAVAEGWYMDSEKEWHCLPLRIYIPKEDITDTVVRIVRNEDRLGEQSHRLGTAYDGRYYSLPFDPADATREELKFLRRDGASEFIDSDRYSIEYCAKARPEDRSWSSDERPLNAGEYLIRVRVDDPDDNVYIDEGDDGYLFLLSIARREIDLSKLRFENEEGGTISADYDRSGRAREPVPLDADPPIGLPKFVPAGWFAAGERDAMKKRYEDLGLTERRAKARVYADIRARVSERMQSVIDEWYAETQAALRAADAGFDGRDEEERALLVQAEVFDSKFLADFEDCEVKLRFVFSKDGERLARAPRDAGQYAVEVALDESFAPNANYVAKANSPKTLNYVINKYSGEYSVASDELTYSGAIRNVLIAGLNDIDGVVPIGAVAKYRYERDGELFAEVTVEGLEDANGNPYNLVRSSGSGPAGMRDAGEYYCSIEITGGPNYSNGSIPRTRISIRPAEIFVSLDDVRRQYLDDVANLSDFVEIRDASGNSLNPDRKIYSPNAFVELPDVDYDDLTDSAKLRLVPLLSDSDAPARGRLYEKTGSGKVRMRKQVGVDPAPIRLIGEDLLSSLGAFYASTEAKSYCKIDEYPATIEGLVCSEYDLSNPDKIYAVPSLAHGAQKSFPNFAGRPEIYVRLSWRPRGSAGWIDGDAPENADRHRLFGNYAAYVRRDTFDGLFESPAAGRYFIEGAPGASSVRDDAELETFLEGIEDGDEKIAYLAPIVDASGNLAPYRAITLDKDAKITLIGYRSNADPTLIETQIAGITANKGSVEARVLSFRVPAGSAGLALGAKAANARCVDCEFAGVGGTQAVGLRTDVNYGGTVYSSGSRYLDLAIGLDLYGGDLEVELGLFKGNQIGLHAQGAFERQISVADCAFVENVAGISTDTASIAIRFDRFARNEVSIVAPDGGEIRRNKDLGNEYEHNADDDAYA